MTDTHSIEVFCDLVASYGANPDQWPADQRRNAVECLVDSEAARSAWRDAALLDADLDTVTGLDVSSALLETVLAPSSQSQKSGYWISTARHAIPYAAAAAIALVVGIAVPSPFGDPQVAQTVVLEPDADTDTNDNLTSLALVDVRPLSDDEAEIETASGDANQLTDLPLL